MAISYDAGSATTTISGTETFDALATFLASNPAAGSASPAVINLTCNLSFASGARLNRGSSARNAMVFGVSGVARRMTSVVFTAASQGILDFGTDGVLIVQGMGFQGNGESQFHVQIRAARLDLYINHDSTVAGRTTADLFYRSDNSIQAVNVSERFRVVYNNSFSSTMGLLLTQTAPLGAVEFLRGSAATALPAIFGGLFLNGNNGLVVPPFTFLPQFGSESTRINWGRNPGTGSWVMNQPTISGTDYLELRTWNGASLEVRNLVYPSGWNKVIRFAIAAGTWENPTKTFSARYGLQVPEFDIAGWSIRVSDDQGTQISTKLDSDGGFGERFVEWKFATAVATGDVVEVTASTRTNARLRARRYGFADLELSWAQFDAPVNFLAPPVAANANLTLTEAQAAAITGISLVASGSTGGTVTISENTTTSDLWHYYRQWIATLANFGSDDTWQLSGAEIDTGAWNVVIDGATYTGDMTTTGIITLANGAEFIGTRTDANGTVAPPKVATISGITAGSRLQIYNVTTATEVANEIVSGTTYTATYEEGTGYSEGDTVRVRLVYASGTSAKLQYESNTIVTSSGWSILASQEDDTVYNTFGIDGSTINKFSADYINDQIDVVISSNFQMTELYAWWVYNLSTESGIREFFGALTAQDQANFIINTSVASIYLDNTNSANIWQLDNRRIYRSDGAYPVVNPTSGGGGIDVVWRNQILIAETGVSGLTPEESLLLSNAASQTTLLAVKQKTDNLPNDPASESTTSSALAAARVAAALSS